MLRYGFGLLVILTVFLLSSGCGSGVVQSHLGEEFSLSVGQSAVIAGEDLKIMFEEIVEDSRCPKDVECIWEGRAIIALQITEADASHDITLTEPGLNEQYSGETYKKYQFSFRLEPYPVEGKMISKDAYRLLMIIDR